jgi:hypothetical protein
MILQDRGSQSPRANRRGDRNLGRLQKTVILVLALVAPMVGQSRWQSGPPGAGSGPAYDVSFGYMYLGMSTPAASGVNLNGLDAAGRVDFNDRWGATVDSSYVRTSNILGTGQNGYVLSFLAGPVFYPLQVRNTRVSLRALVGAGLVDSAVPVAGSSYLHGWVARPSYAAGVGVEHPVWGPFGLRVEGDYLRTAFVDSSDSVQPQNNFRVIASVVVHLNERHGPE